MIDVSFVQTMARYNAWQNESLYGAADGLGEDARRENRGAFSVRYMPHWRICFGEI